MDNLPPLFFFEFFKRVKHDLGYPIGLERYIEFCAAVGKGSVSFDPPGEDSGQAGLMRFLRSFLLENEQHRQLFERIFVEELALSKERMRVAFEERFAPPEELPLLDGTTVGGVPVVLPGPGLAGPDSPAPFVEALKGPLPKAKKTVEALPKKKGFEDFYLLLGHGGPPPGPATDPTAPTRYNLSDEYFPLTRRELMKAWQYLRVRQPAGSSPRIDIAATVRQVARDGYFTAPAYDKNWAARPDALLILADRDDAMTPFHELINRIAATARHPSAHPEAGIWYFHKYPINWLYKKPGLTDASKVGVALRPCNAQTTLALIISDGGAARGEPENLGHDEKGQPIYGERVNGMGTFLRALREQVAHVAWINPLPRNRWAGTAAEAIRTAHKVPMFPALDGDGKGGGGFLQAIQSLMEQK